jgi:septal ring factor EnvC (AmiA/AmiB activator)
MAVENNELAQFYVQRILKEVDDLTKGKLINEAKSQYLEALVTAQNEAFEKFKTEYDEMKQKSETMEIRKKELESNLTNLQEESNTIRNELVETRNTLYKERDEKRLADATKNVVLAMEKLPPKKKNTNLAR